jgi:hypothetical protein
LWKTIGKEDVALIAWACQAGWLKNNQLIKINNLSIGCVICNQWGFFFFVFL